MDSPRGDSAMIDPKQSVGLRSLFRWPRPVKCTVGRPANRVLRVQSGASDRVVLVECLFILHSQRTNLLGYFWIDRVFLLGKGRQSKADCQSY